MCKEPIVYYGAEVWLSGHIRLGARSLFTEVRAGNKKLVVKLNSVLRTALLATLPSYMTMPTNMPYRKTGILYVDVLLTSV